MVVRVAITQRVCCGHKAPPVCELDANEAVRLIESSKVDRGAANNIGWGALTDCASKCFHLVKALVWVLPSLSIAESAEVVKHTMLVSVIFVPKLFRNAGYNKLLPTNAQLLL